MKLIEIVAAEFLIHATLALKVIADDQQAMSYSDERSFATSSRRQSFELSGEVTVLRPHRCPRGLTGHAAQPRAALAALSAEAFPCALMVAGTYSCPARQVSCSRKLSYIKPISATKAQAATRSTPGTVIQRATASASSLCCFPRCSKRRSSAVISASRKRN